MFSQTVEQGLSAMAQLAAQAPRPAITAAIAKSTGAPVASLIKVLQSLRRAGLVTTQRGLGGGVGLSRDPSKISLLEVVNAIEPMSRTSPGLKGPVAVSLAPLNQKLDTITKLVIKQLAATSLADVASRPATRAR